MLEGIPDEAGEVMHPVEQYLNDIGAIRATGAGTAETSYYTALLGPLRPCAGHELPRLYAHRTHAFRRTRRTGELCAGRYRGGVLAAGRTSALLPRRNPRTLCRIFVPRDDPQRAVGLTARRGRRFGLLRTRRQGPYRACRAASAGRIARSLGKRVGTQVRRREGGTLFSFDADTKASSSSLAIRLTTVSRAFRSRKSATSPTPTAPRFTHPRPKGRDSTTSTSASSAWPSGALWK